MAPTNLNYKYGTFKYQGHVYPTIIIPELDIEIMLENLQAEKYNDGSPIPILSDDKRWADDTQGAMCYYDNDKKKYASKYGALYNFHAVNTGKLAPVGWRVPSDDDFKKIELHFGMPENELNKTGWRGKDVGTKFKEVLKFIPGGLRDWSGGTKGAFYGVGTGTWWWSATPSGSNAWIRHLAFDNIRIYRSAWNHTYGFSVRCLRNLSDSPCEGVDYLDNSTIEEKQAIEFLKEKGYEIIKRF